MHPVTPDPRYTPSPRHTARPSVPHGESSSRFRAAAEPSRAPTISWSNLVVGERLEYEGHWFRWDGRYFRNEAVEDALRHERIRRWKTLITLGVVAAIAYLVVMSGLNWEQMTLEERSPYKGFGRIAVLLLLFMLVHAFQNLPTTVVPDLDRAVREKYQIDQPPFRVERTDPATDSSLAEQHCATPRATHLSGPEERRVALEQQRAGWQATRSQTWQRQTQNHGSWYDAIGPAIIAIVVIVVLCYLYASAMML